MLETHGHPWFRCPLESNDVAAGERSYIEDNPGLFLDKRETGEWMGRPLGALKGRTDQANEFARWLRRITAGVTVRALEEAFPYGKSSWSGFRDGSRDGGRGKAQMCGQPSPG